MLLLLLNLVMTMKANMKTKAVERAERASLELKGLATDRIDHPNVQDSTGRMDGGTDGWMDDARKERKGKDKKIET